MGQGLALPIAAMPAAGLMLRLGQDDLLGRVDGLHRAASILSGAGGAVLDYLPVLFAIGVALGLSRGKDQAGPVIACVVSYLVMARAVIVLNPLPPDQLDTPPARWPYGALIGIVAALLAMVLWNRIEGRRRIPPFAAYGIICAATLTAGALLGLAYPAVDHALTVSTEAVADHPVLGGGVFGFFNRLLLPVGMHQVPNAVVWYVAGECGNGVRGDIPCFFQQHDPDAGIYMTGFFPVSMAGLPAAAIAMWRSALPENRRRVGALLLPAAAMSAIVGVTEPIELAFAFTAWPLYLLHAVLTGASLALVNALDIHSGFVFSAGALDYVFNYAISEKPLLLLPISAGYGALYYVLFRFLISRFNLRTPGRIPHESPTDESGTATGGAERTDEPVPDAHTRWEKR
ncbi:PTS transporter subunit EIIC [Streptomyces anulatus]|uniref:PTS transporter subunit EIIC n=1 Tax=Streptomyces anulatus TaxID=1892 RepID=UPI002666CBD6|nr:PTS transporter subunit EIIC [Streptomyces anulatus]